ncbi:DUF262 domain-containing protein [Sorangium sp. So ce118]
MRFRDIPQFPRAGYSVHVGWDYLEEHIANATSDAGPFVMCPDYQRGHVWTEVQQVAFVEYALMGGETSMVITTNCPGWQRGYEGPYELVDGLQRVTAALRFMRDEIPAFGARFSEYTDRLRMMVRFEWRVLNLPTRAEVLRLYLLMNSGGVVHSPEEIARVRALLEKETT